jgi:hypothetical protein
LENLALACRACNLYKGIQIEAIDSETGVLTPLFHPRRQNWTDHFVFEEQTQQIIGISAHGRVTVEALKMNDELAVAARRYWITLELFP